MRVWNLALFSSGISKINWKRYLLLASCTVSLFKINNHSCLLIVVLQVSEYTNELVFLAAVNQELVEEVDMRKAAHTDEIPSWRSEPDDCSAERLLRTDSVSLEDAPSTCSAVLRRWMKQQEATKADERSNVKNTRCCLVRRQPETWNQDLQVWTLAH